MFDWLVRQWSSGLTVYITHPDCSLHMMGSGHPESPERLTAIHDQLVASQLMEGLSEIEAPLASNEQILRVHSQDYLQFLESHVPEMGYYRLENDTALSTFSMQAARRAAGAVIKAVDMVCNTRAPNAFCCVRPPGHHADAEHAMGFCLLNNVAIGIRHALAEYGLSRIAIVDFDVHHGNGTESIFQNDEHVLMVSFFQHPFYPYSGIPPLGQNIMSVPIAAGSGGDVVRQAISDIWLPQLHAFSPEMIFISAGFDAHQEDDMASLRLLESDYEWITREIMSFAQVHCAGRIVSVLEGGYALSALGRSVAAHLRVLSGA